MNEDFISSANDEGADPSSSIVNARLANGMDVVVIPDRRSPIVTHMVWYRTGSADDPPGRSGIAHFLEHLMFKGTQTHPPGQFTEFLATIGGQENAFTSWDFTSYFQRVPSEHLAACMAYEADRMNNLAVGVEQVQSERDVILAERGAGVDSDPLDLLGEAVAATAFPAHPSGRPIIGWRHEIEALGRDDVLAYYKRFYRPQNAVLVVAGDAEPEQVVALAEATYGAIAGGAAMPERVRVQDPPTVACRQLSMHDPKVRQPHMLRLHPVPSYVTADPGEAEAFEVLSVLLGGGDMSVLHTHLVIELGCATSINVEYISRYFLDHARLIIFGTPTERTSPEALEDAVDSVLRSLVGTGFAADDVERAKLQLVARTLYASDSQVSLAHWYGMSMACGRGFEQLSAWQARIEAVSTEALHSALLKLDRRAGVSGYLHPAVAAAA